MTEANPPVQRKNVSSGSLTDRQAAFVREYVDAGAKPGAGAKAALAAGYANGDPIAARVRASELLRNPKVLSALRDELTRKLNAAAALGVGVLIDLAENAPPSVRLQAAKELVDRGYGPVMSRNAHVVAATSIDALIMRLSQENPMPVEEEFSELEVDFE
ncbi:terminase small subunit [Hyphomonas oceanitis]|uniref:Terminase small subunit n=1 Tax=Hyphomonas oceanitis SCH89 TaxID=1280953 RepID=A0A059G280_9PROT|nr:terminase small subunit [Hyphomonas oceanitis]KDA00952.1 hypothetical protein HOC_18074 [Hyphomonas oceanitis SCH89]